MKLSICPREECKKLYCVGTDEWIEKGGSMFCVGKLPDFDIQKFKEIEHKNDYAFCVYTPKKGLVDFLINANDAFIIENEMGAVLKDYRSGINDS